MRDAVYTLRPFTIGDWRLVQRVTTGAEAHFLDSEALTQIILARTDYTEDEVDSMDMNDAIVVVGKIVDALKASLILDELGKQL